MAWWGPYNVHVSWVRFVLLIYADPTQPLRTAGEALDDLGHDLSDLSEVCNG